MSSRNSKEGPGLAVSSSLHEMQELMSGDYLEADESSESSSEHNTTQESLISISLNGSDQNLSRHRSNSADISESKREKKDKESFLVAKINVEGQLEEFPIESREICSVNSPSDRWRCVWSMMVTLGMCSALPYNILIVVYTYLPDTLEIYSNVTGVDTESASTFLPYLILSSKIPVLLIVCMNTYFFHKSPVFFGKMVSRRPMVIMTLVMIAMSLIAQMFALVIALEWLSLFAWICMLAIILSNVAGAVFQNSLFGMAFTLPTRYINAVLIGSNLCGMFTALVVIIMIASAPRIRNLIIVALILIILTFLMSLLICYLMRHLPFYEHCRRKVWLKQTEMERRPLQAKEEPKFGKLHKKLCMTGLNIWLVYMVTSVNYPAIGSQVRRLSFPFSDKFWSPFWFFFIFNIFSMIGNIVSEYVPLWRHKLLWLATFSRAIVFLPFFLLCNYQPDGIENRSIPVILNNDYLFILGTVLLGLSFGYYSSVCMMYAQKNVNLEDAFSTGMLMNTMVYGGMFSGSCISLFFPLIVSHRGND